MRLPETAVVKGQLQSASNSLSEFLDEPLGLPDVTRCVVPGDRVTIAVDLNTPHLCEITTEICERLLRAGMELDMTVLLPSGSESADVARRLADCIDKAVSVHIHDPRDEQQRRYLASSSGGERIYLSEHLVDCDLLVTISEVGFDSLLQFRGTNSIIFPAFSDAVSIQRLLEARCGAGSKELHTFSRELVDEIGWLLGTQFAIQVVPSADGGVADVICGTADQVQRRGTQSLTDSWQFDINETYDLAVVSVASDGGPGSWQRFGQALAVMSSVVDDGGRIAVICELSRQGAGPALDMLRRSGDVDELIKPLRLEPTTDAVEVLQLIESQHRARLYLYSGSADSLAEDIGMIPIAGDPELQRLVDEADRAIVVHAANYARFPAGASTPVSD